MVQKLGIGCTMRELYLFLPFAIAIAVRDRGSLEEKTKALQDLTQKYPLINMATDQWNVFVLKQPKNYSILALFTTFSPQINCADCKQVYDEFYILANSHASANRKSTALYFVVIQYEKAKEVFDQMKISRVPHIFFLPKKKTIKKADMMSLQTELTAENMAKFVLAKTDIQINILRPLNYSRLIATAVAATIILVLLYLRRDNLGFLYSRTLWATISICITFTFMSGQMWNLIRNPLFSINNPQTHKPVYVYESSRYQLWTESFLIAALYAAITVGILILNNAVERKGKKWCRLMELFVGLGVVVVFFNLLLAACYAKNKGYPYSFFFRRAFLAR